MNELTAAHKTLPLGSVVLVKNLDNGKSVKVRINDRGPYKGKRILDLSYAAAKKLDMVGDGQALVGIKMIGAGSRDYSSANDDDADAANAFAEDNDFKPCKDFELTKNILEEDDEKIELIEYEFGKDGKPFVIS